MRPNERLSWVFAKLRRANVEVKDDLTGNPELAG
jgi:hypothetical protein